MSKSHKRNKNKNNKYLKTLSEKITNPEMAYDIDEETPINKNSPIVEERKTEEKIVISESTNNKNLKESIISPAEPNNNELEKMDLQKYNNQTTPVNLIPQHKLSSIKQVTCKAHNKSYLKIDPENFEVVCEKCIEEGSENQLEIIRPSLLESEEVFNCYMHNDLKGSFYCDECKEFICKMCFAETHREHKCHLPEVIIKEFEDNLQESIEYSSELHPILNDSVNDIKKIYDNLLKQKNDTMKIPLNTLKIISNNNDNQINILMDKSIQQFQGLDNEIHDNYSTHHMLKEKTKRYLDALKKICNQVNSFNDNDSGDDKTNFDLCEYHKDKSGYLKEISNYIKSTLNFINIRLNNTNRKFDENKEKMENSLNLMSKEISNYEKSCISSILTGRENRSLILRRYFHFSHNEIKYFKNTIIGFATNDNIFLSGLSICGIYIKRKKTPNNQNNSINSANITNNTDNEENNENVVDTSVTQNENKKISIQITISTMSNQVEGEKLFTQKCELGVAKGSNEPSIIVNFEKGVKITKEKLYLIKVENITENNYIDLWTGSVGKNARKNIQVIRCHNTGIQFLFKQAEGIQTDFDEFDQGIIEGVLYSKNK